MIDTLKIEGNDFLIQLEELQPELAEALKACSAPGDASDAIEYVRANWEVQCEEEDARAYLRPLGAWEEDELQNHQQNLDRLVWLIGCDLADNDMEAHLAKY
jgi:hypothetical protein